jgi:hypothetical protein
MSMQKVRDFGIETIIATEKIFIEGPRHPDSNGAPSLKRAIELINQYT